MKKCLIFLVIMFVPFVVWAEEEKLIDHIQGIADNAGGDRTSMNIIGDTGLAYDNTDDKNLRYVGSDPNNYVMFNGELWRIVGIMNNIEDEDGNTATRVKIVRADDIGDYSFSPTPQEINNGLGDNEWNYSTANCVLTHYFNGTSGVCHNDRNYEEVTVDFGSKSLSSYSRDMIVPVKWNIGAINSDHFGISVFRMYNEERSNQISRKSTSSGSNDIGFEGSVRKPTWVGNIGLLHSSDYGYATTGNGNDEYRDECINEGYFIANGPQAVGWEGRNNCNNSDWLILNAIGLNGYWTMNPNITSYHSNISVNQLSPKSTYSYGSNAIYPVVYLKDNIYLYAGDGSHDNPYLITGFSVTVVEGKDSISVSKDSDLSEGSTVTITVSKEGSKLKELKILDSDGNEVEYTKISDTEYKFIMPASDVRVLAEFLEIEKGTPVEEKKNPNTSDRIVAIIEFLVIVSLFVGVMFATTKKVKKMS